MDIYITLLVLLNLSVLRVEGLSFASYYGSSMVLQHGPARAHVWGYADLQQVGNNVKITLQADTPGEGDIFTTTVPVELGPDRLSGVWRVLLPARSAGLSSYRLTARLDTGQMAVLTDLQFGEVWLCSGQSNMVMETFKCLNSTEELEGASSYENIRLFKVGRKTAPAPRDDLEEFVPWTKADARSLRLFSSLCWSYGRKLHEHHGKPIGLVDSSWGGTRIEAWTRPEVHQKCDILDSSQEPQNKNADSVLWNGMIHPLLKMTISGAIWYQGEANANSIGRGRDYACLFPAMISDWRTQFRVGTDGQSEELFPFGFVQLAGYGKSYDKIDNYPFLRWKQTASKGLVPNTQQPRTFMAAAMDLPDFDSPYGSIHPRDKTSISDRLVLGYKRVVLGEEKVDTFTLLPSAYRYLPMSYTLDIQYDNQMTPIQVLNNNGFEVCCSDDKTPCGAQDPRWVAAPIRSSDKTSVSLNTGLCDRENILGHRYAWRTNPCAYKQCAVYTANDKLPAPVYYKNELLIGDGTWHKIAF